MPRVHETLGPEGVRTSTVPMTHSPVQCANMAIPLISILMRIDVMSGEFVSLNKRFLPLIFYSNSSPIDGETVGEQPIALLSSIVQSEQWGKGGSRNRKGR